MYSYLENYISFWMSSSGKKIKGLLTLIFMIRFWPQFSLLGTVFYSSVQLLPYIQIRICNKRLYSSMFWSTEVKANDMLSPVFIVVKVWAQRLSNKSRQISNFTSAYVQFFCSIAPYNCVVIIPVQQFNENTFKIPQFIIRMP